MAMTSRVESESDCEYFGDKDACLETYAMCKVHPCKDCAVVEKCREKQFEDMCYVRGTHGFSITCNRAFELIKENSRLKAIILERNKV